MKRYYILYKGIVQGVGFRWTIINIASSLGLTGYVKNLDDGNVAVEVQGKDAGINEFIKKSLSNFNSFVQIDDYVLKQIPIIEEEENFGVKF